MADLDQAFRQNVQAEAPQELTQTELHLFASALVGIVFVAEGDRAGSLIQSEQTPVADRHPVSIAREISEHGLRSAERFLAIDYPRLSTGAA